MWSLTNPTSSFQLMDTSHLIPISDFQFGFSTCSSLGIVDNIAHVDLDNTKLGVHKISSRTSHVLVPPPPPVANTPSGIPPPLLAWEAIYPQGSINPTAPIPGGFGFYLSGPKSFAERLRDGAQEVVMSYRMMLDEGWEWAKGGKLPGVFGGVGDLSYTCTGGRQENRCQCFNLRPMWRPNSVGELYAYIPPTPRNISELLAVPPISVQNSDYGLSVGRGAFNLDVAVGKWASIAFRVKLNDIGMENGEIQLWIDGVSVILASELVLRDTVDGKIKGMHFQTFFGGHSDDWASPKDQRAWFADITGVVIQ